MKNEKWGKIKDIFQESLERPVAERDLFLRDVCGQDTELLEEIEQLLAAFEENEYAFESGAVSEIAEFIIDETGEIGDNKHFGRYKVKKLIGVGGMGKVYLAEDTELERPVALKILTPIFFENQGRVHRFIREAKTASALNHPNILTIYEIGQSHDSHFIATEYVAGETLREKQNRKPLSFDEILEISIQVVSAIGAAHQARIIHRDIKPENIMMRPDGIVKVLDFGLAKLLPDEVINIDLSLENSVRHNTLPGMILGTAAYMSPEQSRGKTLDSRTDLWSFGVCLYEMLNGDRPFKGETISDTIANVLMSEMPPLSAQIPINFSRIVKKSLEKNCTDRYQKAEDFAADLIQLRDSLEDNVQTVQMTHFSSVVHTNDNEKSNRSRNPTTPVFLQNNFYRISLFSGVLLCLIFISISFYIYESHPPVTNPEATRWLESGSESALNGDFYKAQKLLERAVSTDNRLIKAYAKLAEVQMELDYEDKAAQSILRLTELMPQSSLSEAETEYLLAVVATVRRDYNSAVSKYENIVAEAPESTKRFAYFDLGRALEKIDANDRAIEAYRETVNRDPQFAAAFLRLGNLYWHSHNEKEALSAFDTAAAVYTANSNYDGLGELFYQKGNLYNYSENLPEAEKNLKKSLELARATDNLALQIKCNLDLGRIEYSYGNTTNARELIDEALNSARINQLENLTLNGVIDLGTLFFMKGEYDQSFGYLNQALQIARVNGCKRAEARALLSLGSLSLLRVQPVQAVKYIEPALNFYRANNFRQEKSQALLALGYAYDQAGNHQSAIELLKELLNLARQKNDRPLEANTESAIGLTLIHTERFTESLEHSEKSFQINQSLGREQLAAYATLNRGQALTYLGRFAEARQILNQTEQSAVKTGDKQLGSWRTLLLAKCALFEGKTPEALELSQSALQTSGQQVEEIVVSANIVAALANIQRNDLPNANRFCQTAKNTAEKIGSARLSGEINLLQAEIFLRKKQASQALLETLQARTYFAEQQSNFSEFRSLAIAAEAASTLNQSADAKEYSRQADNIFTLIERSSDGTNSYYFRNRRDILFYRSLINRILTEQPNKIK